MFDGKQKLVRASAVSCLKINLKLAILIVVLRIAALKENCCKQDKWNIKNYLLNSVWENTWSHGSGSLARLKGN